jgi:hypothetical protein
MIPACLDVGLPYGVLWRDGRAGQTNFTLLVGFHARGLDKQTPELLGLASSTQARTWFGKIENSLIQEIPVPY